MSRNSQKRHEQRQPGFLLVVLCFLPLIALNIGYSFLEGIDNYWKIREQQELANQEIETLAAGSEFSYQFA
ncbi:MAG: hypothetical protein ACD_39C01862G0001, partial [uncultured bacterium]